jgi:hypothetical protein
MWTVVIDILAVVGALAIGRFVACLVIEFLDWPARQNKKHWDHLGDG